MTIKRRNQSLISIRPRPRISIFRSNTNQNQNFCTSDNIQVKTVTQTEQCTYLYNTKLSRSGGRLRQTCLQFSARTNIWISGSSLEHIWIFWYRIFDISVNCAGTDICTHSRAVANFSKRVDGGKVKKKQVFKVEGTKSKILDLSATDMRKISSLW